MSITSYELADAVCKRKTLYALEPEARGDSPTRLLLLSKAMQRAVVDGPWKDETEEDRFAGTLKSDLERFVSGKLMRISLGSRKSRSEDMKRLMDAYEVWEFKSNAKRGIRVFGRFAGHNIFVATHWQWRDVLDNYGSDAWAKEIDRCTSEWFKVFPNHPAHAGDNIDAYLSNAKDIILYY